MTIPAKDSESKEGCFLTTACVQHKNLPDDCEALGYLRMLRDDYMMQEPEGRELVKHYYQDGPSIVRAINTCTNKAEILDYMYEKMILPSVQLVKEKKYMEAVDYYKTFVMAIRNKYQ
jgi:hypothetical protein